MFGALKKLFSKSPRLAPEEQVAPPNPPPSHYFPPPAPEPALPVAAPAMTAEDTVWLQLTAIVPKLPGHLSTLVIKAGGAVFALPVNTALAQLPSGKVRIPFGQLRQGVPPGTFADNETHDEVMIELPLSPILAGMNPTLLARRAQKRVDVPEEIAGVFGPKGTTTAKVATDASSAAARPAAAVATARPAPPASPAPSRAAAPAAAPVSAPAVPKISESKGAPKGPSPASSTPIRVSIPSQKPVAPTANPLPFAQKAGAPAATRLPSLGARPAVPAPAAPVAAMASAAPVAPVIRKAHVPTDVVSVPLSDISEGWPDPVRQEIARGEWDLAMVVFPVGRLEPGLKTGRLKFTWGEIRQWLNPPIGSISSPHVDVAVELPLKVIAPLFMAARRPVEQRKVNVGENIPDVFAGLKAGAAQVKPVLEPAAPIEELTEIAEPVALEPPPVAPVAARPAAEPVVSHAPRPDPLGTIFGQPLKSDWSPGEIAQRMCALDGVGGAIITMGDGLLVAGHVPPPQNPETLAAFLPQIFARLNQYAGEMQLGTLSALHLSTAEAPCAIYKAGKLYIGALGQRGQHLPEAQLQRIASEVGKRNP